MDFQKFDLKPMQILKISVIGLFVVIIGAFLLRMVSTSFDGMFGKNEQAGYAPGLSGGYGAKSYDSTEMELSARNVDLSDNDSSSGKTAEDYEITSYDGSIETGSLHKTCSEIAGLKSREYVIFENASEYDHGCSYVFKVEKERTGEILSIIENLKPKNLVENTKTIKKKIDDYTSEEEILKKKKETVEETLNDAINSYNEISRIATQARDVETLAKIIDSKIKIIEKLSQERININEQLDRLARAKSDQLDRLKYTFFKMNVYENKYLDLETVRDSWKAAIQKFFYDANKILQDLSVNLITVILTVLQYALYFIIVLLAGKYLWRLAKYVWNK